MSSVVALNRTNPLFLRGLYTTMLRIRRTEECVAELVEKGEIRCPCHLCIGQEAIATGVCAVLRTDDYVFGGHRSHGHYLAKGGSLKEMMAEFSLFSDLIRNVELAMAKADLTIARLYASLVTDIELRERVWKLITEEFERTRRVILAVTGQKELLETNPVLLRSIRLRNPYVDPMSLVQVDLLRRKRAGEDTEALNYALGATINGIAAGLHNTG